MGKLVSYFSPESTMSKADAWFYAWVTISVNCIYFIYSHNYMLLINQLGLEVRAGFCSLLYRKALKLSATSLGKVTTGKIITLITKDVMMFDSAIMFGNDLWIGVIQTSIIGYMMYRQIGVSAIIGLIVFIAMIPLQCKFFKILMVQFVANIYAAEFGASCAHEKVKTHSERARCNYVLGYKTIY